MSLTVILLPLALLLGVAFVFSVHKSSEWKEKGTSKLNWWRLLYHLFFWSSLSLAGLSIV